MASQITSFTIVYSTAYSGADQRKHQSSASLAFVRGIHRLPVNSPHKGPVTQKMFPFDDVIMNSGINVYDQQWAAMFVQCPLVWHDKYTYSSTYMSQAAIHNNNRHRSLIVLLFAAGQGLSPVARSVTIHIRYTNITSGCTDTSITSMCIDMADPEHYNTHENICTIILKIDQSKQKHFFIKSMENVW